MKYNELQAGDFIIPNCSDFYQEFDLVLHVKKHSVSNGLLLVLSNTGKIKSIFIIPSLEINKDDWIVIRPEVC